MMNKMIYKNIFALGIIFLFIYISNVIFPITFDDDFVYGLKGNPFLLQWKEYLNWHGRYLTHTIGRIILQWKDPFSNIFTALISWGFIVSVGNIIRPHFWKKSPKENLVLLIPISLILSCLINSWTIYTQTIMVVTYMLTWLFLLLFLSPYFQFIKDNTYTTNKYSIFILGILAGFTHEQSIATIPLLLLMMIYLKYIINQEIPKWFYIGIIGFIMGFLFLAMAPSMWNGSRDNYGGVENWQFLGQIYNWHELGWKKYFYSLANVMIFGSTPWIINALPTSIIFFIIFKKNLSLEKDWTKAVHIAPLFMYLYSWMIVGVMMFAPLYWYAQSNFGMVFLYTSLGMIIYSHVKLNSQTFDFFKKVSVFCSALAIGIWLFLLPVWMNYHQEYYSIVKKIENAKQNNISSITVKPFSQYKIQTPFGAIIPVYLYTSSGFYRKMAAFYEIDSIIVEQNAP